MKVRIRLEAYLHEKGISKNEFARRLGLENCQVRPYFRNGYNPKLSTIGVWASALGCKVVDLIEEVPHAKNKKSI